MLKGYIHTPYQLQQALDIPNPISLSQIGMSASCKKPVQDVGLLRAPKAQNIIVLICITPLNTNFFHFLLPMPWPCSPAPYHTMHTFLLWAVHCSGHLFFWKASIYLPPTIDHSFRGTRSTMEAMIELNM